MRAIIAVAVLALIGCFFWWREEDKWCGAMSEAAWSPGIFFCLPLSPFAAVVIVVISACAIAWIHLRQ
ncbi:MAG: hypothetical protein KDJ87_08620 [Rhizobiaceae bacterium]|nr:hypothetical protein [Rhizobiaceae bacterium]